MTVAQLQFSKIGKVMRHITLLEDQRVPRDAEFAFRARAQALVERWQSVLGAAKGAGKKDEQKEGLNGVNGVPLATVAPTAPPAAADGSGGSEEAPASGAAKLDVNGASVPEGGDGEYRPASPLRCSGY